MNVDEDQLKRKKKQTASIVCLVAGALIIIATVLPGWIKSDSKIGIKVSLYGTSWCGNRAADLTQLDYPSPARGDCSKVSNGQFVKWMKAFGDKSTKSIFGPMGWITLGASVLTGLALLLAGGLGLKDRFVRSPIAVTTVGLLGGCVSLIAACVFVATKPGYVPNLGPILGLSWPFFVFGVGIVAGIAGAQMLSKSFAAVSDPYWDGLAPEPGLPPMAAADPGTPAAPPAGDPPAGSSGEPG